MRAKLYNGTINLIIRIHKPVVALIAIGLGLVIALAADSSRDTLEGLMSIFVMGVFALVALSYPLSALLYWLFLNTFIDSWVELDLGRGIPDVSFGRFAAFILFISLLMRVTTGRFQLRAFSLTDLCVFLTPVAIAVSAPRSVEPTATVQTALSMYFIPLMAYFLAKQLIRNKEQLHWLLGVVAFFGTIAGAHALYEALTGNIIFMAKAQEVTRLYRGDTGLRLIVGLVGETGSMGRVLAITLLVTLYLFAESKNSYLKPYMILGAVAQFGGMVATFSRTPTLTFLVGLFILQFAYPALRRLLIVLTLVVAVALALNWERIQRADAAQDRIDGVEDYNDRTGRWEAGFNMWLERPVIGWGMGRYSEWSGRYRADGSRQNIDAVENDFLLILVGAGLIGFTPYALFLFTAMTSSIRLFFRRKTLESDGFIHRGTIALFWGIMVCFAVGSLFAINAFVVARFLPFALFGAIIGTHQPLLVKHTTKKTVFGAMRDAWLERQRSALPHVG